VPIPTPAGSSATPAWRAAPTAPAAAVRPGADRLARLKAQARKPGEASFFYYDAGFANDAVKILPG